MSADDLFDEEDLRRLRDPDIVHSRIGLDALEKDSPLVAAYTVALERSHRALHGLYATFSTAGFHDAGARYLRALASRRKLEGEEIDFTDTHNLEELVHESLEWLTREVRGEQNFETFAARLHIGKYDPVFSETTDKISRKRAYVAGELRNGLVRFIPDIEERHVDYYADPRTPEFEGRYQRAKRAAAKQHLEGNAEVEFIARHIAMSIKSHRARVQREG